MRGRFAENLIGKKYGRLTVVGRAENRGKNAMWICVCECGTSCVVYGTNLRRGMTNSCGCYMRERSKEYNTDHGGTNTRLFYIWQSMKDRCNNPNNKSYSNYGGRGITVCDEWQKNFEAFRTWAQSNGYRDDLSLDREKNDEGYSPENCRWATIRQQQNNRRNNRHLEFNGESHTVAEWAAIKGIRMKTLHQRLSCGWSVERALTEPVQIQKRKEEKK